MKIGVYVPASHLYDVKQAMFNAGAGKIDNYEHCSWQTLGEGQFKPMAQSDPYCGTQGQLEIVEEYRLELVCENSMVHKAIDAMKAAHPYETPAYDVVEILKL